MVWYRRYEDSSDSSDEPAPIKPRKKINVIKKDPPKINLDVLKYFNINTFHIRTDDPNYHILVGKNNEKTSNEPINEEPINEETSNEETNNEKTSNDRTADPSVNKKGKGRLIDLKNDPLIFNNMPIYPLGCDYPMLKNIKKELNKPIPKKRNTLVKKSTYKRRLPLKKAPVYDSSSSEEVVVDFWEAVKKLNWADRSDIVMTRFCVNKLNNNERRYVKNNLHTYANNIINACGDIIAENNDKNKIANHVVCKGLQFYTLILECPEVVKYMIDGNEYQDITPFF